MKHSTDLELSPRKHQLYQPIKNELHQNKHFDIIGSDEIEEDIENIDEKYGKKKKKVVQKNQSTIVDYSSIPNPDSATDEVTSSISTDSGEDGHRSPIFTSFVNLASTVIGAGILGLPYAFSRVGWFLGIFSLLFCGFLSYSALYLLSECVKKVPSPCTFYSVAEIAVPQYSKLIDFAIMIKGIGVATSYLIVILDSLPKAFHPFLSEHWNGILFENRVTCLCIIYTLILPLSYLHNLESLKYSSLISLFMILFLVGLVVLYSLHMTSLGLNPCDQPEVSSLSALIFLPAKTAQISSSILEGNAISSIFQIPRRLASPVNLCEGRRYFFPFFNDVLNSNNQPYSITDFFRVFPIFLFSYTCHQNTFNIINELERPTPSRINSVFILTMIFCMTLYLIIAVSAYLTFGDLITSDILYSYPENTVTSICRFFMALVVACHYPLQLFASRKCALTLWQSITETENPWRFIYFSMFFNILTFLLASVVKDLGFVLSILGSITSALVILFLPSTFYLKLFPEGSSWKRRGCQGMFGLGVLVLVVSLTFNIINASKGGASCHR